MQAAYPVITIITMPRVPLFETQRCPKRTNPTRRNPEPPPTPAPLSSLTSQGLRVKKKSFMASNDEDECLAKFLESEVLADCSDQEEGSSEEDRDKEEEEREGKEMQAEGGVSDEGMEREIKRMSEGGDVSGEEEEREVKKMLAEDGEITDEEEERETKGTTLGGGDVSVKGKSIDLMLSPPLSAEESEASLSALEKNKCLEGSNSDTSTGNSREVPRRIESGIFSKIPPELLHHILKFLSSEDLISCSMVCRFLSYAASDESLWLSLYVLRWGLLPPNKNLRECAWKKLYIERDEEDMVEFVRNCPPEFREYYIQMQVAKRSQAPLTSQVCDDRVLLDKTMADQVSIWKKSRGLSEMAVADHACSGFTCTCYQISDVFICERTGQVHVCDDTCREIMAGPVNELLVGTISGCCFDRLLSPVEIEPDADPQQAGVTDEAGPFMGSGRFARAYLLGYNCADEKELEATLRFC